MRHLGSILLGLVLGPVVWLAGGYGGARIAADLARSSGIENRNQSVILGVVMCLVAGLALGILLGTRLSPLGPVLVGIAFLALGLMYALSPRGFTDATPDRVFGADRMLTQPLEHGWAYIVGLALLIPLLSPHRWRRDARKVVEVPVEREPERHQVTDERTAAVPPAAAASAASAARPSTSPAPTSQAPTSQPAPGQPQPGGSHRPAHAQPEAPPGQGQGPTDVRSDEERAAQQQPQGTFFKEGRQQ